MFGRKFPFPFASSRLGRLYGSGRGDKGGLMISRRELLGVDLLSLSGAALRLGCAGERLLAMVRQNLTRLCNRARISDSPPPYSILSSPFHLGVSHRAEPVEVSSGVRFIHIVMPNLSLSLDSHLVNKYPASHECLTTKTVKPPSKSYQILSCPVSPIERHGAIRRQKRSIASIDLCPT